MVWSLTSTSNSVLVRALLNLHSIYFVLVLTEWKPCDSDAFLHGSSLSFALSLSLSLSPHQHPRTPRGGWTCPANIFQICSGSVLRALMPMLELVIREKEPRNLYYWCRINGNLPRTLERLYWSEEELKLLNSPRLTNKCQRHLLSTLFLLFILTAYYSILTN